MSMHSARRMDDDREVVEKKELVRLSYGMKSESAGCKCRLMI